jgi:hypothetical protein
MGVLLAILIWTTPASAWDRHQEMVNRILLGPAGDSRPYLSQKISIPCIEEEQKELDSLAARIGIRAGSVEPVSKQSCGSKSNSGSAPITIEKLLGMGFIDEPDSGMDQDLPDSADPNGYRKWMGGTNGPTSQGFRHMVFPGFEWSSPLASFQVPPFRIGDAFGRIEVLKQASDSYFASGNVFFGLRTLLWREHLIQDLLQPFHSTQIPSLRMVPWKSLFRGFVKRTTHAISNYHYAYEGMVLEMVKTPWEQGIEECLQKDDSRPYAGENAILAIARKKAPELGSAMIAVFGNSLKSESVNLPEGVGAVDYFQLIHAKTLKITGEEELMLSDEEKSEHHRSEEVAVAVEKLRDLSCELMKEAARTFWGDLDQALMKSASSNTGK